MNSFAGVGVISDIVPNEKVLKFTFSVLQEKPCSIPCLVFYPKPELVEFIEKLDYEGQVVWLSGKLNVSEFTNGSYVNRKVEVVTFEKAIKPVAA